MKTKKGLIHGIAQRTQCGWAEQDYRFVQKMSAQHARLTGHKVIADLGYVVEYEADTVNGAIDKAARELRRCNRTCIANGWPLRGITFRVINDDTRVHVTYQRRK